MNNVVLIGRLTKDPVVSQSRSQNEKTTIVARFTLAVSRQKQEEVDFITCVAFGKIAEVIEKYIKKGNLIAVQGNIRTGMYTNKDGQKIYTTDVLVTSLQFLEKRQEQDGFMNIPDNMDNEGLPFN